jgi:non-ribosomal peptide synthase protein (TIGR01720 family)
MGYGMLRYLRRDINEQLKSSFTPQISFNYLGQISLTGQASPPNPSNGQAESGSSAYADQSTVDRRMVNEQIFRAAKESSGASAGPATRRAHLIEVGGGVVDGILSLSWSYGKDQFNASSIEQFADVYMAALKTLIQHCLSPEAGGYTSSDFPLAGIGQSTLDKVLSKVTQSKRGTKG